jgi:hypothetical protein
MEAFEQQMPLRHNGAARPAIGEERIETAFRLERRIGLGQDSSTARPIPTTS